MKNLLILATITFFVNTLFSQSMRDLEGIWVGHYYNSLGKTGLKIKIYEISETSGTFKGSFEFYPLNSNKNVGLMELGKYNINGMYKSKDDISFEFESWEYQPNSWTFINQHGRFNGKNKITGKMLCEPCGNFKLKKWNNKN